MFSLLSAHPDFPRFRSPRKDRALDRGDPEACFVEASVWADQIRDDPAFYDPDQQPTQWLPGFPDMRRHRGWHYVNQPIDGPDGVFLGGELHLALPQLQSILADPRSPDRAYALVWLLHLVADLHQPLHVATRRGGLLVHDLGGNRRLVEMPEALVPKRFRGRAQSLHEYWDDLGGPPWLAGKGLTAIVDDLIQGSPPMPGSIDLDAWRRETHRLAAGTYRGGERTTVSIRIDAMRFEADRRTAHRQLLLAGTRLAFMLRSSLASPSTETGSQR